MHMSYIDGIGGFLFRSKNPEELQKWYVETLGIVIKDYVWEQKAGPTVLQPAAQDADTFDADKPWMLNFRVHNLKEFIAELKAKNVDVEERDEWNFSPDEVGTFARIHDPEGNPIELWQPGEK
jgi:predicted enzyme related to lactoylglutathione lyase